MIYLFRDMDWMNLDARIKFLTGVEFNAAANARKKDNSA